MYIHIYYTLQNVEAEAWRIYIYIYMCVCVMTVSGQCSGGP